MTYAVFRFHRSFIIVRIFNRLLPKVESYSDPRPAFGKALAKLPLAKFNWIRAISADGNRYTCIYTSARGGAVCVHTRKLQTLVSN